MQTSFIVASIVLLNILWIMETAETEHRSVEALQLYNGVFNDVDIQTDKQKCIVKLTSKAFVGKVEWLQRDRKSVLTKATNLIKKGLMHQRNKRCKVLSLIF